MKKSALLFAMFLILGTSCKKQALNQTTAQPPLLYDILDKYGKNILDTPGVPKDSINISYTKNGVNTKFCDSIYLIFKINNTIVAGDFKMFSLNSQNPAPASTFAVTYHGNFLGTINLGSVTWVNNQSGSWEQATGFTFNNVPVQLAPGTHIYQLQLQ